MNDLKIKELVLNIMNKAIEKTANTNADVFVNFAGHVRALEVQIYLNGWIKNIDYDFSLHAHLDPNEYYSKEECLKELEAMYKAINIL